MTVVKREQRFCLCGWSVYGTDLERRNAFELHWRSRKHKRRSKEALLSSVDGLVEADIEERMK